MSETGYVRIHRAEDGDGSSGEECHALNRPNETMASAEGVIVYARSEAG